MVRGEGRRELGKLITTLSESRIVTMIVVLLLPARRRLRSLRPLGAPIRSLPNSSRSQVALISSNVQVALFIITYPRSWCLWERGSYDGGNSHGFPLWEITLRRNPHETFLWNLSAEFSCGITEIPSRHSHPLIRSIDSLGFIPNFRMVIQFSKSVAQIARLFGNIFDASLKFYSSLENPDYLSNYCDSRPLESAFDSPGQSEQRNLHATFLPSACRTIALIPLATCPSDSITQLSSQPADKFL